MGQVWINVNPKSGVATRWNRALALMIKAALDLIAASRFHFIPPLGLKAGIARASS
jgi:hypothetical protein